MKIEPGFGNRKEISRTQVKEEIKTPAADAGFKNRLLDAENRNFENRISELVEKITAQGEKLAKKADIRELKIYKQLISEFLSQVLSGSQKFSRRNFLDRRGRHRVYAIVRKIDDELEKLTREILSAEKDNLAILQSLGEIRGLILDIFL